MPRLRSVALTALATALYGSSFGCDTHAVGIEDCREIETARCAASHSCDVGITAANEDECERFARDNCLHGLPTPATPTASQLDNCRKAIARAGACADIKGKDYPATSCTGINGVTLATASVCDIVQSPDEAVACSFLLAEPKPAVHVDAGQPKPVEPADSGQPKSTAPVDAGTD